MRAGHKIILAITLISVLAAVSVEWMNWADHGESTAEASIIPSAKTSDLIRLASSESNNIQLYYEDGSISTQGQEEQDTPSGSNVGVELPGIIIKYETITAEGDTNILLSAGNPAGPIPDKFYTSGPFLDITTTATYSGRITLAIHYDALLVQDENKLGIYHWNGTNWEDATTRVDTDKDVCYGEVTSLSWFFIGGERVWREDTFTVAASILGKAVVLADELSDPFITVDPGSADECTYEPGSVQGTECGIEIWDKFTWLMLESPISPKYLLPPVYNIFKALVSTHGSSD